MLYKPADIIASEGVSFQGEVPAIGSLTEDLASASAGLASPLRVQFDISVGNEEFLLLGSVHGEFQLQCCRCLNGFAADFKQDLESVFPKETIELDAAEEIRQAVLLTVPAKPVCSADCKGLCPLCGMNRNVKTCGCEAPKNSPFAGLKKLYNPSQDV